MTKPAGLPDNCMLCLHCEISPDPDPFDSFCDDDKKARCKLTQNQTVKTTESGAPIEQEPFITVGCRPYRLEAECAVPDWCPLRGNLSQKGN